MTTREVERELAALLNRHAEDAMSKTNTQAEREKFLTVAEAGEGTERRRWVLAGAAAAVVAAIAGIALWSSDLGDGDAAPSPANAPDSAAVADANLAAAEGLAAAFDAHDAEGAAPYLAPGTEAPWPEWSAHVRRDAAWNIEYLMDPCIEVSANAIATTFNCPFVMHLLGSQEVGKGPFPDNHLEVSVSDGGVVSASSVIPYDTNGVGEHLDAVHSWVADNHRKAAPFLLQDEAEIRPADWPRWTRLWERYIQEYVETNAG